MCFPLVIAKASTGGWGEKMHSVSGTKSAASKLMTIEASLISSREHRCRDNENKDREFLNYSCINLEV